MIPKYDPYLEKYLKEYQENPRSRVFAPLAEAYRKSGLVDEALEICREGLEYHPNFISGMVALARCYFDKGLYTATINELEKVISEVPDNYLAQKILAQSYALVGDKSNALKAYKMVLFLNPADGEAKAVIADLEDVRRISDEDLEGIMEEKMEEEDTPPLPFLEQPSFQSKEDFKIIDDMVQGSDMGFEEKPISQAFSNIKKEDDPEQILTNISTMTMGELLESQGHKEKALEVYKKILAQNPDQPMIKEKITALENELGIHEYEEHIEELTEEASDSPDDYTSEKIDNILSGEKITYQEKAAAEKTAISNLSDDLDDQWIFQNQADDTKVARLKSFLNKVKLYKRDE
jgi:tetratricopeptide (TPR) repeat protein